MNPPSTPLAPPGSPALARRVLDALPHTIYAVDLEGRIIAANAQWSRFAADNGAPELSTEDAVIGSNIFDAFADDASRQQIERAMAVLRETDLPAVRWEFPCSSPDEERVFLMHISAIRGEQGVEGYVFSSADISASHHSREALINTGIALSHAIEVAPVYDEVSRQVRRAVKSSGVVIAIADEETTSLRIVHRWGYTGEPSTAALQQRLLPVWLSALASKRNVLSPYEAVHDITHATGSVPAPSHAHATAHVSAHTNARANMRSNGRDNTRSLELTIPLSGAEGVLGAITLVVNLREGSPQLAEAERDIATIAAQTAVAIERAWLVKRVEHKRRLEALGEVATGIAHELRNPLFGISSAAQLLLFRTQNDPAVEKNVSRILREVNRLSNMVTSLLDFGRPAPIDLHHGDPDTVWDDVLELEQARLDAHHITLRRIRPEHPVRCRLDPEQLKQVYLNILVNAVDAAPPHSVVTLASAVLPNGGWRCRLTNGGSPIPAEVLPHVFEFFYSTKTGGTGIGLALCQRIMDEHGGSIAIESSHELGTTVTLALPPAAAS